jgi:myosin V
MVMVKIAIHQKTSKYEDDFVSSFWISNNFELLCVIKSARKHYPRPVTSNQDGEKSAMAILAGVDTDLRWVMADHFNGWVREFRKKLGTMVVPAVIENQSLPGYICKQSGGIWSQWTAVTSSSSQLTIDQMVDFLSNISQTMKCYYVEKSIHNQLLTELVRIIGVSAFNHLLTRKNFCTWKRGILIVEFRNSD